jgi:carbamoyl-phosphate synthase large subunit
MENIDPMGIHTGESIVVAPSQTLSDKEYHVLRSAAIRIVRALKVEGACNVQFALDQKRSGYWVVEVNPRASRSSALASKATGYPIARVATKIALGYTLDEIENRITGKTAFFEPSLDYVVVKIPRWPFDKFYCEPSIGTQMKSTGEAMAIGRSFEEALGKALRSLEMRFDWRAQAEALNGNADVHKSLAPSESRLQLMMNLLQSGKMSCGQLSEITGINEWFVQKIKKITDKKAELAGNRLLGKADAKAVAQAKALGFSDYWISELTGRSLDYIRVFSQAHGVVPKFNMVDTCSAEFPAYTPYFYSTYENAANANAEGTATEGNGEKQAEGEAGGKPEGGGKRKVIILGSGPIRIGQGIEFDYSTVHAVMALRGAGFETIVINNNPETVSTDFDISDRLYFEPLRLEDALAVMREEGENLEGVITQFGGQTAINLVSGIVYNSNAKILGTSPESIDTASNRKKFKALADSLGVPTVRSSMAFTAKEAAKSAVELGFPVLVRPSYVLGGRAMHICHHAEDFDRKIGESIQASAGNPVIIDHFLADAIEVDVDIVGDGEDYLVAGIMEQVEEAGIHSGDSAAVLPARRLSAGALEKIEKYSILLCRALRIVGLCNIQMAVQGEEVFVIEANPRASRTVPFVSKAIGVPIAKVAALCQVGISLEEQGFERFPQIKEGLFAVKVPVFPYARFPSIDCAASSEMKSTGEVMAFGQSFEEAYLKGLKAAGQLPKTGRAAIGDCGKWTEKIMRKAREAGFELARVEAKSENTIDVASLGVVVDGLLGNNGSPALRKAAIAAGKPVVTSCFGAMALFDAVAQIGGFVKLGSLRMEPVALSSVAGGRLEAAA